MVFSSNGSGKSNNMMIMMMLALLVLCCFSMSAGGGWWYLNYGQKDEESESEEEDVVIEEEEDDNNNASGLGGRKFIKIGGQSMSIDSANCKSSRVRFRDTKENSKHAWTIRQVPGKDYYYISSKAKQDNNCAKRYLTSNSSCNKPLYLTSEGIADRQYFTFNSTGDGYQIRNVNCKNKGLPSYVSASGVNKSDLRLNARGDTSFELVDAL